jgi:hypothetical protein
MTRRVILPVLCAAALILAAAPGVARVGVVVGVAPPAHGVEPVPAPGPGYVWQPGCWSWNGVQYVWVPGAYVAAPYVHAVWVPGAWIRHGPGWVWVAGGTGGGEAGGACLRRKQSRLLPESPICGQSAPRRW